MGVRAFAVATALVLTAAAPAYADSCDQYDVGELDTSCPALWHERNRVFAEHGYCFKSARAVREFGRGCVPPYGQLSGVDRCYVAALRRLEREGGCAAE